MRYDKLILRSFLTTFVAVIVLLGLTFGVLSLWIPQTMMKISYSVGMDKASVNFAATAYEKFGVVDYAGYGADVALQAGLHAEAESCLESLIADENFEGYCEKKNAQLPEEMQGNTFQAYCYRQLCISIYEQGEGERAVERAFALMDGSFLSGNPLVALLIEARMDKTEGADTLSFVYEKMSEVQGGSVYAGYSDADKAYFDQVLSTVASWLS